MTLELQPYQYMQLKAIVYNLIDNYKAVNDYRTVDAVQSLAAEQIRQIVPTPEPEIEDLITFALDHQVRREATDRYFETFKTHVVGFLQPSKKQVEKVFRKVKKLKQPDFEVMDLREHTYVGWNDLGTRRKYLLYYADGKLAGLNGDLSVTVIKGFCAIYHQEGNVSLFTAISKTGGDGRYTKKGNYICANSDQCNRQLYRRDDLDQFLRDIK